MRLGEGRDSCGCEVPKRPTTAVAPAWLQFHTRCDIPNSSGSASLIFFVGALNSGLTSTNSSSSARNSNYINSSGS
ncbi:unnamed protein product [Linum trigynum]|uniref:Uncharacterized protein n=1 Tax=Linum trigynum TaxID=586398 RepID=A0AAV2G942_9ROSI